MTISAHRRRRIVRSLSLDAPHRTYAEPLLPLLDEQFGAILTRRVIERMVATTLNTEDEAAHKLSNCVAYLLARSVLSDPSETLVANLGPDEAWHIFILFTREYTEFCERYAGQYLHHDPAGEAALINRERDTAMTINTFEHFGIPYDPLLWQDHLSYPDGAVAIRSGFRTYSGATTVKPMSHRKVVIRLGR